MIHQKAMQKLNWFERLNAFVKIFGLLSKGALQFSMLEEFVVFEMKKLLEDKMRSIGDRIEHTR